MPRSEFVEYLLELLAPMGGISAKRMFSGSGIYFHDVIFGIVIQDVLYLKVDNRMRPSYEAKGLKPFTYAKKDGEVAVMSYYRAPEEALEDSEELCRWARDACQVSYDAIKSKPGRKPKKTAMKKTRSPKAGRRR